MEYFGGCGLYARVSGNESVGFRVLRFWFRSVLGSPEALNPKLAVATCLGLSEPIVVAPRLHK